MNIDIVVFDGADELDFVGPYEIFQNAAAWAAKSGIEAKVRLVTLVPQPQVVSGHSLRIIPDGVLEGRPDILLVPGGGWVSQPERSVRVEIERGDLPAAVAEAHRQGSIIAGVCTGVMVLAHAGLLTGRPATTHHRALDDLGAMGAQVVDKRVVDDGDIITCGGVTSGLDLALWVVERFYGARVADAIAANIEHPRPDKLQFVVNSNRAI